jgi:FtsH-binding integral membrane protein
MIPSMIVLICSKNARESVPLNYILLFIFTLGETVVVAQLTALLEVTSVLLSILALVLICGTLFVSALFTKISATLFRNLIIAVVVAATMQLVLGLVMLIIGANQAEICLYATGGIFVVGFYILIDLVQIMTPSVISYDDYILGAMMLYVDIIRMFIYILMILG